MSMSKKITLIIATILIVMFVIFLGKHLGQFVGVCKNIAVKMVKDSHERYVTDDLSVEYIRSKTGTTNMIKEKELPEAFQPYKEVIHPPFGQGACHVCHAPRKDKVAALVTKTTEQLCYRCHPAVNKVDEKINCNKCHNPHHADKEKLVRNKVIEEECPAGDFENPTGTVAKRTSILQH